MPVSNVSLEVDWGYLPLGFFGVDERFGRRDDFQRFVDALQLFAIEKQVYLPPGRYGVRGIPTMLLFKDGQPVAQKVGAAPRSQIQQWVEVNL